MGKLVGMTVEPGPCPAQGTSIHVDKSVPCPGPGIMAETDAFHGVDVFLRRNILKIKKKKQPQILLQSRQLVWQLVM